MAKKRTVNERLEELEVQVARNNRTLRGENGHKGLVQRQGEDDERFKKLYGYYYNAYLYLKTIVNIGRWVIRVIIGVISLLSITKWKEIWQWFIETFSG